MFAPNHLWYRAHVSLGAAFRVLLGEVATVGLDPAAVCDAAAVDRCVLEDGSAPFGFEQLARILAHAAIMADDPCLGLHMAARGHGRGVLAYLARAQRTVGEALHAFARFAATEWRRPNVVQIEHRGAATLIVFDLAAELSQHAVAFLVARTAIALRQSRATAREIWFDFTARRSTHEYERLLGCPVHFGRPRTAIFLKTDDLTRPLPTANLEAAEVIAAALARPVPRPTATAALRLAAALETALSHGDRTDRESLARSLGMSGKTLARRLAGEHRHFRDVVDEVRCRLARRLVMTAGLDLGEVAARVGFSDQAAFCKAFRRWFGVSPSQFRVRSRALAQASGH